MGGEEMEQCVDIDMLTGTRCVEMATTHCILCGDAVCEHHLDVHGFFHDDEAEIERLEREQEGVGDGR
jgi:hypothetical protein